jgi:LacI family transcriptional regulator
MKKRIDADGIRLRHRRSTRDTNSDVTTQKPKSKPASAQKRVTLQLLAKHLGLSTTTVSVVISNSPAAQAIPAATRERILEAAAQLHYRPNYHARSLRGSRSMTVGILATESSEGYLTLVMSGVEQVLSAAGYFYFSALHYNQQELVNEYSRLLGERSVEGLLLISTPLPTVIDRPIVSVSGHSTGEGVTNIFLDHRSAATIALRYLKELGHRKIAYLRGWSFNVDTDERWLSIVAIAAELGIPVDPELCTTLQLHSWSPQTGYEPVQQLLQRTRDFTAIFCFNDIAAIGAMRALYDAGLSVPRDVSLMGFDDITGASFSIPSLTTVRQPLIEMGSLAASTLLARIENPNQEYLREIQVQPSLTIRESTRSIR